MTDFLTPAGLAARVEETAKLIEDADGLIVAAGAGIGVDSGLPDFRGTQGFWREYPALQAAGLRFEDIASPDAFASNPRLAWGFYGHRLKLYRRAVPHAGFCLLASWGQQMTHGCAVFTSNVDGQFQRAGFREVSLLECHGSIHRLQCTLPCTSDVWSADGFEPQVDEASCMLMNALPTCPHCGAPARPNVFMFNDRGWVDARLQQQDLAMGDWLEQVRRPVLMEIGAGTAVATVRAFSRYLTQRFGRRLIRINPREAQVDPEDGAGLPVGALVGLGLLDAALVSRASNTTFQAGR